MSKRTNYVLEQQRAESYQSLLQMADRDLCEMARAHFESHPCLPGEKTLKDDVNQRLNAYEDDAFAGRLSEKIPKADKENIAKRMSQTMIRETTIDGAYQNLRPEYYGLGKLNRTSIEQHDEGSLGMVYSYSVPVELQQTASGEVWVMTKQTDGVMHYVGTLPDSFLSNNPMNVDVCGATLQITDFSNGMGKNLSSILTVNTDLMSGDVVDLDESVLPELSGGLDASFMQ